MGQQANGSDDTFGTWITEKNGTATPYPAAQKALHNWTSISMNLYGARKRATYFYIDFILIKSQYADLMYANGANISYKLLTQYLERPLIYSNLQTDVAGDAHKMFKLVRRYKYFIPPSQTTDVDSTTGKIKEVKIFMRHDRMTRS